MIEVPTALRSSPRFWEDVDGRAWLDRLPDVVDQTCAAWGLQVDGSPRHGSNALVVPVTAPQGPAVLRLTPPDGRSAEDLRALRFWSAGPVVSLLRANENGSRMLLERLDADASLATRPPAEAAEVLGEMVAALAVVDPPEDAPRTSDAAQDLADYGRRRWHATGRAVPPEALGTAVGLAFDLSRDDEGRAVDGDLHADQLLPDASGAWRVVDPLLMSGDPAYDLARAVWTTIDRLPDAAAILGFTDRLVGATGLDRSRAEAWLIVRTVAYWLWCLEAGLTDDSARCARFVAAFADD